MQHFLATNVVLQVALQVVIVCFLYYQLCPQQIFMLQKVHVDVNCLVATWKFGACGGGIKYMQQTNNNPIKHNRLKIPTGRRQSRWLHTSVAEDGA